MNRSVFIDYLLLLAIGLIWGSQFALNNIALESLSPITIASYRAVIGFIALAIWTCILPNKQKVSNDTAIWKKTWILYGLIAFFETVVPLFLLAWGLKKIDGGEAAILMGTIPIFTILITTIITGQDKFRLQIGVSIVLGFIGIIILSFPNLHLEDSSFTGEVSILLSALSFAISLVIMKSLPAISPTVQMRNILGLASIPLLAVTASQNLLVEHCSVASLLSLLILGLFCTGIVYLMFIVLIRRTTSTFASLTNYLIPLVGVLVGNLIMHEEVTRYEILSLITILTALIINQMGNFSFFKTILERFRLTSS